MDFKQKLMNKCVLYGMADFKKNIKGRENEFREDVKRDKDIVALVRNMIEVGHLHYRITSKRRHVYILLWFFFNCFIFKVMRNSNETGQTSSTNMGGFGLY